MMAARASSAYFYSQHFSNNASPKESASIVSQLIFSWFTPLISIGYRKQLKSVDVWRVPSTVETAQTVIKAATVIRKRKQAKQKISLGLVIWNTYWPTIVTSTVLYFLADVCTYMIPTILKRLYKLIEDETTTYLTWIYITSLFIFSTAFSIFAWQAELRGKTVGCCVKSAFTSLIYKKCIKLKTFERKMLNGELINLTTVDVNRVAECFNLLTYALIYPVQIVILFSMLYNLLGVSAFSAFAIMALVKINALFLAKLQENMELRQLKCKDERILNVNELVSGIKIIKCFVWESAFMNKIDKLRKKEMSIIKKCLIIRGIGRLVWGFGPKLISLTIFATYILIDEKNVLDVEKIFITLTIVTLIEVPMQYLPIAINLCVRAHISINRLNQFLNIKIIREQKITGLRAEVLIVANPEMAPEMCASLGCEPKSIKLTNAKFTWSSDESSNVKIKIESLEIHKGELVAVVGLVGSGKSSLLSALLGEIDKKNGTISINGRIAYVAQQAWIQNATVKENILFGKPLNKESYDSAIQSCDLEPDLVRMAGNDEAEIGEKGINLSGGQKQRISLARAVYDDADIYLFDDPLSAVDPQVGEHIFNKVIGPQGILKHKTRVLVTHSLVHLPSVDHIIVLENGEIKESYNVLMGSKSDFADFLKKHRLDDCQPKSIINTKRKEKTNRNTEAKLPKVAFTSDEHMERGLVKISVYLKYLSKFGYARSLAAIGLLTISMGLSSTAQIYLSQWSMQTKTIQSQIANNTSTTHEAHEINCHNLKLYTIFIACQCSIFALFILVVIGGATRASIKYHQGLMRSVLRAPMRFFDTTPSGRIINRFSKDINTVDGEVSNDLQEGLYFVLDIFQATVIICINLPIFVLVSIITFAAGFYLQKYCMQTMDQLRRLESVTCSPIYSFFSESISGSSTIRAFGKENWFIRKFENLIDENMKFYYAILILFLWSAIRSEFIKNVFLVASVAFSVFQKDYLGAGNVALVINCAVQNSGIMALMWYLGKVENDSISIERLEDYINLSSEATRKKTDRITELQWPQNGKIQFDGYGTTYGSKLPLVLKRINLTINPREKIGLIGRTGAGKSSVALALFRMMEATEGKVIIDGVPIEEIWLHDLRNRLTIIPQDPVLFSGILRFNLDPCNQYSDDQLWKALELAHLKDFVVSSSAGLNQNIAEGGSNLSVGQKQLICLARALLKKTKILVLDEATAAVDSQTDALIQSTIRSEFSDCTILTIAHRLNTIMDCNRLIVLNEGKVVAFDKPEKLKELIKSSLDENTDSK